MHEPTLTADSFSRIIIKTQIIVKVNLVTGFDFSKKRILDCVSTEVRPKLKYI